MEGRLEDMVGGMEIGGGWLKRCVHWGRVTLGKFRIMGVCRRHGSFYGFIWVVSILKAFLCKQCAGIEIYTVLSPFICFKSFHHSTITSS